MITVFTSCYNHAKFLPLAIDSVLAQSYEDFELLLINDGSTDESLEIMYGYAKKDNRIKVIDLIKQINKGPVINKSIEVMKGDYWTWCPADDIWVSTLLEKKLAFSKELSDRAVIYSDYYYMDDNGNKLGYSKLKELTPETFSKEVWLSSPIGFTGIWIPKAVLEEIPFPNHVKYSEDLYWMIKATIHGVPFHHLKEQLYYKRKHDGSMTSKNLQAILDDIPIIRGELAAYRDYIK